MNRTKYRITGPCFYLDEDKALVAVPIGTIVEISELPGAMLMRWRVSDEAERREQFYTPQMWQRHVSKHIQPM
jgi:hypothetical protein